MAKQFFDTNTKWEFLCLTDASGLAPPVGGLVLQHVRHDGHNFAKDIRVVGLWIELEVVIPTGWGGVVSSKSKSFYTLAAPSFTAGQIKTLVPKRVDLPKPFKVFDYLKESDAALDFKQYFSDGSGNHVAYGVSAEFLAPTLFGGASNPEYIGLTVEQIFLFSRYGNHPVHEPSGALAAARHHPLVRYEFLKNPAHDPTKRLTRVSSIRFDYRLHLNLDRHHDEATNAKLAQLGNQVGLFADNDSMIGAGIKGAVTATVDSLPSATSAGAFSAAEKPVVLEVTAPGLQAGYPFFGGDPSKLFHGGALCWDNIHFWGAKGAGEPLISTPGAFHAAHLHWRWGFSARFLWPRGTPPMIPSGQPLVDPGIWMQTILVAAAKNDVRLDPSRGIALNALSKSDWKTLFDGLRPVPEDISAGGDIVLWYSSEVPRVGTALALVAREGVLEVLVFGATELGVLTIPAAAGGTIFIHGIFFAHDAEQSGFQFGSTDPFYWPRSEEIIRKRHDWFRTADKN